jgi:hypothetical protein
MSKRSSSSDNNKSSIIETESTTKDEGLEIQRKVTLATDGFLPPTSFCDLVLRDGSRLSRENALTIAEYIIAMKKEIDPRLSTIKNTIQFLHSLVENNSYEKRSFLIETPKDMRRLKFTRILC